VIGWLTRVVEKTVDGVTEGDACSERGSEGLFHKHDYGFDSVRSRRTLQIDLSTPQGRQTAKMARPRHNSGKHVSVHGRRD
jgi:hypothetical protein